MAKKKKTPACKKNIKKELLRVLKKSQPRGSMKVTTALQKNGFLVEDIVTALAELIEEEKIEYSFGGTKGKVLFRIKRRI